MACPHISTRFRVLRIALLHSFLVGAMLNPAAVPTSAATQRVEIGRFTSAGTVTLQLPKFHEQFADGTRISEITVAEYNGQRVVRRKGYSASGNCRVESTPIMTSNGQAIPSQVAAPAGTPVYLPVLIRVAVTGCSDSGCRDLAGVDALGGHETIRAWCDQTELSDNLCRCHVDTTESVDTKLFESSLVTCRSSLGPLTSAQVSEWVRFQYIG